jgi:ABC-type transport system substrate-binding protein
VKVTYAGQALAANQIVPPGVTGHDPGLPPRPAPDPAGANALLDRVGYGKRDRAGFRLAPDGKPLTLTLSLRSGGVSREIETQWKRDVGALGLRTDFHVTPFQEVIKEIDAGKFQMYFGGYGGEPSGYAELIQLVSTQPPTVNSARFKLADYDRAMEAFLRSPAEAGQRAAARTMSELAATWMPMLPMVSRLESHFLQPWVEGFRPPAFDNYWKYLDLDLARRNGAAR